MLHRRLPFTLLSIALAACGTEPAGMGPAGTGPAGTGPAGTGPASTGAGAQDPRPSASGDLRTLIEERIGVELPSIAKPEITARMLESVESEPTDADLGATVRLLWEGERDSDGIAQVSRASQQRFDFEVTLGPAGIAAGGALFLQVSPFWGWTSPQAESDTRPGYTTVECDVPDVEIVAQPVDQQLIAFSAQGGALPGGTTLRIAYGAGVEGVGQAVTDRFAEVTPAFWFGVDGDGDGRRRLVTDAPALRVAPGPPAGLLATIQSTARPGEPMDLTLAMLDVAGNFGPQFAGYVELNSEPFGLRMPAVVQFAPGDGARHTIELTAPDAGTYTIVAKAMIEDPELADQYLPLSQTTSNPCRVSSAPRLVWVDLHGHSAYSDGSGSPADYYTYAREVAALDAVALTDHDAWGLLPLVQHPELYEDILDAAVDANDPGEFLALPGFEWTSWIFGHRHVVHFGDETPLLSSLAAETDTPEELWSALAGLDSLSIPHHPGGGPIAVDWDHTPPADIEPLVEVMSVHGSSVAPFAPRRIYAARPGHYAVDALGRGHRYGFLGSGDSHDGHPGLPQLAGPHGGLAAVMCEELTAEALLAALRARRVYATSGARIILRANLEGAPMGSTVERAGLSEEPSLLVEIIGTAPIDNVLLVTPDSQELIHDGSREAEPSPELRGALPLPELREDLAWFYLQVEQSDGQLAWSSPFFLE